MKKEGVDIEWDFYLDDYPDAAQWVENLLTERGKPVVIGCLNCKK